MFAWRERLTDPADRPVVELAVTDRYGGVGQAPYDELNLADHVGDREQVVRDNRARLAAAIGLDADRVVFMRQVHGRSVALVEQGWAGSAPEADAMVTRVPGLALAVLVADCTPVLLADPQAGVLGVAHAGRRGLAAGVVDALVEVMRAQGAREIIGRVGPSICGRCYEVPLAMREEVAAVAPEARAMTAHGTPALDVGAGVMAQLAPHCDELAWLPGCSAERADLFSHRRDGATGRYAGLAWLA
ncbi:MAG TPA: peptidoglycan editing factor PgeF [Actinomycetes bacterium]|nr:peptidoglycan editing factor PgeF [Actinomycetes bacterium]